MAEDWIHRDLRHYICHLDARSLLAARDGPAMAAAVAGAGLAVPDGMPLVWLARSHGVAAERVYGPDFMAALMTRLTRETGRSGRHVLFGSTPAVLERLTAALERRIPGVVIAGCVSPPMGGWTEPDNTRLVAALNAMQPDVIWVGLGAPKQEIWMAANRAALTAPLLVGVGAAFDFLSGTTPQAPRWMQRSGLEWLFRLMTEPRRLAGRYAATVPRFIGLAVREVVARRLNRRRASVD